MSDYRYQPVTDQWILIAGNRQARPNEYVQQAKRVAERPCPFCLGQEEQTPDAVSVYPALPEGNEWLVRVFPNKFPALSPAPTTPIESVGPYQAFSGFGIHELIILSPRHVESFSGLTLEERTMSLVMFQHRLRNAAQHSEIKHTVIFQNCRSDAGASIQHVHCQLIATAVIPPQIAARTQRLDDYHRTHSRSLLHELVEFELSDNQRIVGKHGDFVALCPFASRLPYETWIIPTNPHLASDFTQVPAADLTDLGLAIHQVIAKLEAAIPQVAYNFVLHLPPRHPNGAPPSQHQGWWIEIFPRINKMAGFEWATSCMINQVPPELAAQRLREQ